MKRRISNLISSILWLLCAASAFMWIRSYWKEDIISMRRVHNLSNQITESSSYRIHSLRGGIRFQYEHDIGNMFFTLSEPLSYGAIDTQFSDYPYWISNAEGSWRFGFQYVNETWVSSGVTKHELDFLAPWAIFSIVTGMLPLILIWKNRHARQLGNNFCTTCGYDLRATPDRCPECGKMPAKEPVTVK